MKFTIFGGNGFVGSALAKKLRINAADVWCPTREDIAGGAILSKPLGNVVYTIGRTADFRWRLSETIDAHVSLLDHLINSTQWTSWLYLSSTRVYGHSSKRQAASETDLLEVFPSSEGIYEISKLLGESLCLARPEPTCRVARLSNIFGPKMHQSTFLASVLREARTSRLIKIKEQPESCKDYISINDAAHYLIKISQFGEHRIYNVASGVNISHEKIAEEISRTLGKKFYFDPRGPLREMPKIDVGRMHREFGKSEIAVEDKLKRFFANSPRSGDE